jgi:hypothetical protein
MSDNEESTNLGCGCFIFFVFLLVIFIIQTIPFSLRQANNTIDEIVCYHQDGRFNVCALAWWFVNRNASELYNKDVTLKTLSKQVYENKLDCNHDSYSIQCQAIALRVEQLNGFSSKYVTNTIAAIYTNKINSEAEAAEEVNQARETAREKIKIESYINNLGKN